MKERPDLRAYDLLVPVGMSLLVILFSVLLSLMTFKEAWHGVLFVTVTVAISCLTSSAITAMMFERRMKPFLEEVRVVIVGLAASRSLSDEYIADREKNISCTDIWIMSPDLHKDVVPESEYSFKDIVFENISSRGITYTYILPDTPEINLKLPAFLSPYNAQLRKKLVLHKISLQDWNRLPYVDGDFVIYNPTMHHGTSPECYYELPIKGRDQWVKVEDRTALSWAGRVMEIVPALKNDGAINSQALGQP